MESWTDAFDGAAWTGQAWRLHQSGEVLLAGPFAAGNGAFALFGSGSSKPLSIRIPRWAGLFTATLQPWIPAVGGERLPAPGDPGRVAVEETIHRLFVDGVSARDAQAHFDRTYHDEIVIPEAPSLPYGGD